MIVCKCADSRIIRFYGDPVVSAFQKRQDFDLIERPAVLIAAHGTAANVASVHIQAVALVCGDQQRGG